MNIIVRIALVLAIIVGANIAVRAPLEKLYGPSLLVSIATLLAAMLVCYSIDRHLHKKRLAELVDQSPIKNPDLGESTCLRLSRAQERELCRLSSMHIFVRTSAVLVGGAVAVVAALMTTPGFTDRFHSRPSSTFQQFFDHNTQSRQRIARDAFHDPAVLDKHAERTAAQIDRALQNKQSLKDTEREMLELGKFVYDYTKPAGKQYDEALNACGDILDFSSITDRDEIHRRIEKLAKLESSVDALEEVTRTLPRELRAKTEQSNLSAAEKDAFMKGFTRSYQLELRLEAVTNDSLYCLAAGAILRTLDQQWGRWRVDPADGQLIIHNAEAAKKVAALIDGVRTTGERSEEVRMAIAQAIADQDN